MKLWSIFGVRSIISIWEQYKIKIWKTSLAPADNKIVKGRLGVVFIEKLFSVNQDLLFWGTILSH